LEIETDDGDVVSGVEGAFFAVDDLDEFVAHGLDVEFGEVAELFAEAQRFVRPFIDESQFDAVAVHQYFFAGPDLYFNRIVLLIGEDAEE